MCPTGWFIPTAEGPDYMNETLGEVHIMGELKVDGVVKTTDELHEENVRKAAEMEQALARGGIDDLMDFDYPPEAEAFRTEFRAWLDEHLTDAVPRRRPRLLDGDGAGAARRRCASGTASSPTPRYAAIAWPEEYGGRGAGIMEQVVFAEEMHRAERAGHAEPARPVEHRAGDHPARHRRAEASASSPACCAATTSGARASPSPTRAATSRR